MKTMIDLRRIERAVLRDYYQDGLTDILLGVYLTLIGLALPAGVVAPFIILPMLAFVPLLRFLKKRLTYPRTGYATLRDANPGPLPWFVLGSLALGLVVLVVVLIAAGVIARPARWYSWMPIMFGIWMAGILIGLAVFTRLVRYYVIAGAALAGGPFFALLSLPGKLENIGLFFAALGALLLISGIATLALFVIKHPIAAEEADDASG
ncbi:MAG: hypothetical protein HXY24_17655 [Rubrivivax sp.]|nr:hypothetical protein [Rubrivivax sp.]